jgi:Ala-tRNA(Pro) deacylase
MNPCMEKLRDLFARHGTHYEIVTHPQAFTAQEAAEAAHLAGHSFCKSVVVYVDDNPAILVLAAPHIASFEAVRVQLGGRQVRLATEGELASLFPDCDVGSQPPLPGDHHLPVYMDAGLTETMQIAFEAGLHTQAVLLPTKEYLALVTPKVLDFGREPAASTGG